MRTLNSKEPSSGGYAGDKSKTEDLGGRVDHVCSAYSVELVAPDAEGRNSQLSVGDEYRSLREVGRGGVLKAFSDCIFGAGLAEAD